MYLRRVIICFCVRGTDAANATVLWSIIGNLLKRYSKRISFRSYNIRNINHVTMLTKFNEKFGSIVINS